MRCVKVGTCKEWCVQERVVRCIRVNICEEWGVQESREMRHMQETGSQQRHRAKWNSVFKSLLQAGIFFCCSPYERCVAWGVVSVRLSLGFQVVSGPPNNLHVISHLNLRLARTINIRCIHILGREINKCTVVYGVYMYGSGQPYK